MNHPSIAVGVAAFLSAVLPGQDPEGLSRARPLHPPAITPIHTAPDDPEGGVYGIWAAGDDYKVSFHDGMTFIPYLGGGYPHNQEFSWRTLSVTFGGQELVTRASPKTRSSEARYEYDLGGIVEAYDVRRDGLEQTFVLDAAPAGAGDLVVRGRVTTALGAEPVDAEHGALRFEDAEGRAILSYGAATAVDASGRRAPMVTTWRDGEIALALAGSWLRDATYPVVVDPLLTSRLFGFRSGANRNPLNSDVVREGESSTFGVWHCNTRQASATDADLWVMVTNDNLGYASAGVYADLSSAWSTEEAQIAYVAGADRCVCVFTRNFGTTRNIRWHAHEQTNGRLGTGFGYFFGTTNNWRPDIGGVDDGSSHDKCLLVFQHEPVTTFVNSPTSEIYSVQVDFAGTTGNGQGTAVNLHKLFGTVSSDNERPSINQKARATGSPEWMIAFQWYVGNAAPVWNIVTAVLDSLGNRVRHFGVHYSTNEHRLGPVVAGIEGRYAILYATAPYSILNFKTSGTVGTDLRIGRVDHVGGFSTPSFRHPPFRSSSSVELQPGAIAFDSVTGDHWLTISRSRNRVVVDSFGYRVRPLTGHVAYTATGSEFAQPGGVTFNPDDSEFVFTFAVPGSSNNPVYGSRFEYPSHTPWATVGTSCSNYQLSWHGSQQIGSSGVQVRASYAGGVPPNPTGLHLLALSLQSTSRRLSVPGVVTGCDLYVRTDSPFFVGVLPSSQFLTTHFWTLDLPEFLSTTTLHFQDFHLDAGGAGFRTTGRLSVQIVK